MRIGVHERIGRPELLQPMYVAVADHRLAMPSCPALPEHVEIRTPREHPIPLDGVEQMRVPGEGATQRAHRREEGMRRNHQSSLALTQACERFERVNRFGGAAVI